MEENNGVDGVCENIGPERGTPDGNNDGTEESIGGTEEGSDQDFGAELTGSEHDGDLDHITGAEETMFDE
jgi:hypothetical protein